jgi:hypothetical protein
MPSGGTSSSRTLNFVDFRASVIDFYDWDPTKHITVPNPDYGSTAADAVAPSQQSIVVYHRNAIRVERAGLASPSQLVIGPWDVDASLKTSATINPTRRLPGSWW